MHKALLIYELHHGQIAYMLDNKDVRVLEALTIMCLTVICTIEDVIHVVRKNVLPLES